MFLQMPDLFGLYTPASLTWPVILNYYLYVEWKRKKFGKNNGSKIVLFLIIERDLVIKYRVRFWDVSEILTQDKQRENGAKNPIEGFHTK